MNKAVKMLLYIAGFWLLAVAISSLLEMQDLGLSSKVLVIPIKGTITFGGLYGFSQGTSASAILEKLDSAEKDSSVKAVILEIDSEGGAVVASKAIADKVRIMKKPVVALVLEKSASGAYWVASSSDYIIADQLSLVGSIGVIGSYLEFSELMNDYGVEYERIVAGDLKDMGSPFKKLSENERENIQDKIDMIHEYFLKDIQKNRNLTDETMQDVQKGSIYLGAEALELNLVDALGNKEDAFIKAKELANVTDAKLTQEKGKGALLQIFDGFSTKFAYSMGQGLGAELKSSTSNMIRV